MADGTHISWSDATWNVVTGCTKVSAGCDHCYIERQPPFRMEGRKFDGPGIGATTGVRLHPDRLTMPLHWRKPRKVFVCSLADLFHDEVPDDHIAHTFAVMVAAPHHQFQVLTKRHARMRSLLISEAFWRQVSVHLGRLWNASPPAPLRRVPAWIWIGVSAENQHWADIRIPALLDTPAAVHWISAEPLLGPVDLSAWTTWRDGSMRFPESEAGIAGLDWVVTGGESGPGARPAHPDWFRSIRDQCVAAGVAYHHKQNGAWAPTGPSWQGRRETDWEVRLDGHAWPITEPHGAEDGTEVGVRRVGAKAAGRLLDGQEWNEYPEPAP